MTGANTSRDTDLLIGGRYRLLERLAAGGMGEVWRAEDTVLGRPVAVKTLRAEYAGSTAFRIRFRQEARHAAGLSHPGIAGVFDYGDGAGADPPYLVMEHVDGESLSDRLARDGALTPAETVDILGQAAAGLAAAHRAGIVHRDVKPGNLLLRTDGAVKMADFGIAKAVGAASVTETGTVLGTPSYLSPEQASGRSAIPASDVYGLGVIAHHCLTGRPPFDGDPLAVLLAHRDRPLPPLPAAVPAPVRAFVAALTDRDPRRRPTAADAAAWACHLRARDRSVLLQEPDRTISPPASPPASPPTGTVAPPRALPPARRAADLLRPLALAAVTVVAVTLLGTVVAAQALTPGTAGGVGVGAVARLAVTAGSGGFSTIGSRVSGPAADAARDGGGERERPRSADRDERKDKRKDDKHEGDRASAGGGKGKDGGKGKSG